MFNKSKFLFICLSSITTGLLMAIIVMAFIGPGGRPPGSGDPDFWLKSGNDVYYNVSGGNVGIGTTNPQAKLHIGGTAGTDGIMFPDGTLQTSSSGSKRARVYNSVAQSIPNGIVTPLNFNSESWDNDNIHSGSSSRLTCTTPGLYFISGSVHWWYGGSGRRLARIRLNGTTSLAGNEIPPTAEGYPTHNVTTIYYLNPGDYVEFCLYQDSGSALNTLQEGPWSPSFMMVRIGG